MSHGGNVCCTGGAIQAGAFDQQRDGGSREDILVYTTEPFEDGLEVSGTIDITLYVSSDARDTDFTVKLIDVYPDGTAYNLDETIQRVRYREGYDRQVFMEPGQVYEVEVSPMSTSQLLRARAPDPDRGVELQLPALHPEPEHGREQLRRDGGRGGPQRGPPLGRVSVEHPDPGDAPVKRSLLTASIWSASRR